MSDDSVSSAIRTDSSDPGASETPSTQRESKPTIYDVADRAGVAISTVSRVVNDSGTVADETRERVVSAIQDLQFRPSRTAKALAQSSATTIAVAVPTFTTPSHNEFLKGVRSRLDDADVDLLICDLKWEDPEMSLVNFLRRGAIDGLLVGGFAIDPPIGAELESVGIPVVLFGSQWADLDALYWDETTGAETAVQHLIDQGHEKIGVVTTHLDDWSRDARVQGYRNAMTAAGLDAPDAWIAGGETEKHAGYSEESGYEAMQTLLRRAPELTAVFATSDVQAIGAWQALRHEGRSVPGDVALVGYDDIKVSRFIGLTSVAPDVYAIGESATDRLLARLQAGGRSEPLQREVGTRLAVRASSKSG